MGDDDKEPKFSEIAKLVIAASVVHAGIPKLIDSDPDEAAVKKFAMDAAEIARTVTRELEK